MRTRATAITCALSLLAALRAFAVAGAPAAGPRGPVIGGCAVFPADNAWNRDVSHDPVDPRSKDYISSIDSHGRQRRGTVVSDQGINEREQGVHRVQGRAARAGGEDEVMTSAPASVPQPQDGQKLIGARNENSVLFALNAGPEKAAPSPQPTMTATNEASGLIDIRQLSAQMRSGGRK